MSWRWTLLPLLPLGGLLACATSPRTDPTRPSPLPPLASSAPVAPPPSPYQGPIEIDAHVHAFRKGLGGDVILPLLDRAGVSRAVLISAGYALRDLEEARAENDFVAAEIAKSPRLIGYCGVHPLEPWAVDELSRCAALPGMIGLKVHVNEQGLDLSREADRAAVDRLFTIAEARSLVVLVHADRMWRPVVKLAETHPRTRVILAHALLHEFRELSYLGMRFALARKRGGKVPDNVFADVSSLVTHYADAPHRDEITWQLRGFGVERLIFGSDHPLFTPEETLGALQRFGLSQDELHTILVETPRRVFPPPAGSPPAR